MFYYNQIFSTFCFEMRSYFASVFIDQRPSQIGRFMYQNFVVSDQALSMRALLRAVLSVVYSKVCRES